MNCADPRAGSTQITLARAVPWLFAVLSAARSAHGRAEQARKDRLGARFCQRH